MISNLQSKGAKVILDSSQTDALKYGMWQRPFAMKPNVHEWRALTEEDRPITEVLEKMSAAHDLEYAIAMRGAEGLILVNNKGMFHAIPPKVEVGSTVGCGDAVTAGFLYGKLKGFSLRELASFAVACGTASAEKEGTELCTWGDARRVWEQVQVENR